MGTPADSERSREALIEAAGEVFAEHGFAHATVREICRRAGTSPGAINYHFGTKEKLYEAAMHRAHPASMAELDAPDGASAEERLRRYVSVFLSRTLDDSRPSWHGRLLINELSNPTAALDGFVQEIVHPHFEHLYAIVSELLGDAADDQTTVEHALSVVGQCVFYRQSREIIDRVAVQRGYGGPDAERLAEHIAEVSLAGIAAERAGG